MTRYKVKKPFVDYGMYHEVDEVITDTSIITNREVKLWEGTLAKLKEDGTEIPFEKLTDAPTHKPQTPKTTKSTTEKTVTAKVVTPPAKSTAPVVKVIKTATK